MKTIVEVNPDDMTYVGPWNLSDDAALGDNMMLQSDALEAGYRPQSVKPFIPDEVPSWTLEVIITERGKKPALDAALAALKGPRANVIRAKWAKDPMIARDGEDVNGLGRAIGYSPTEVDDLFRAAYALAQQDE